MHRQPFKPSILTMLITGLSYFISMEAAFADSRNQQQVLEDIEVEARPLSTDEKGEAAVFSKNVSNVYVGKEYLERYRVDSAGDVLKGLNGVYNMNSRTAGSAITPNIRGITGKGRIPVTIDGTEQTVDVWLNNYGVGDRNYVDPALFRSIAVEKSPAMTRGMKSGVGGAMAIRTIEPEDIIPEGKKWGIELKGSFSGNSTKNQNDLRKYLGIDDYRRLPGGATADGPGGGFDPFLYQKSPQALVLDSAEPPKQKTTADNFKFGGDQSYLVSAAFKTDLADGLAAYSYRNKGNYFAGKHGAGGYSNNPVFGSRACYEGGGSVTECRGSASFVPNMAKMYSPGEEVFNSNTETKTLLLKNNWHLPDKQKIGLQYMKTNILFGEVNPFVTSYILNYSESNPLTKQPPPPQVPNISSKIQTDTYKIGYGWQPEGNKWINLQANAWHVRTTGERHQSGGSPLATRMRDMLYDDWRWCNVRGRPSPEKAAIGSTCASIRAGYKTFSNIEWDENTTEEEIIRLSDASRPPPNYHPADPESMKAFLSQMGIPVTPENLAHYTKIVQAHNQNEYDTSGAKRYQVISGARQNTHVTRSGFDISNRFQVRDNLAMTVAADYQRENLEEYTQIVNSDDFLNMYGIVTGMAAMAGPRSAKRREWGANLSFDWQPTDRLDIQAGVRYQNFKGEDVGLARARANRDTRYEFGSGRDGYAVGAMLPYYEIMENKQEAKDWIKLHEMWRDEGLTAEFRKLGQELSEKYGYDMTHPREAIALLHNGNQSKGQYKESAIYRIKEQYIPIRNGKLDSSGVNITPEMYNEKVTNPQDLQGDYYKYIIGSFAGSSSGVKDYPTAKDNQVVTGDRISGFKPLFDGRPYYVKKPITDAERWRQPQTMRSHAWSPMLALTYRFSDNQRVFARYAQMTRFPSLYELTGTTTGGGLIGELINPELNLKPERSINWELGYGFNFTPYWSKLRHGDVRLTYYHNTIKNVLDTSEDKRVVQYDKKITSGLELQSRIDTGRYFAAFGATYRLKQVTCDRDTAFAYDMYMQRVPSCIEGGFGATRFYQALQPKYSLNLDVGTRLLGEKLELGMRGIYHSKVETKQYDQLLEKGLGRIFYSTGQPRYWHASLIIDAYGRYNINKNFAVNFGVSNLTDRYYLDPMSNVAVPGPGRTFTLGIKGKF